ncbi:hypothetical protein KHC28_14320 [Ancylobacter sonchi]|uniref:hypothetical protein n=1 Tax=Ancylobacter TaxID=99 RepID=UPI001BD49727|nr:MULTISPECIES: hypothetical protein [Ancylobacter]MBS7534834.1 hypothetical protein [Ancylobacter sonchi]MCB4770486.1 hypothetical protein [Ancylobacter sp. Lp-2]
MKSLEQTARRICGLDLLQKGFLPEQIATYVDRFWPAVANEVRQGIVLIGEWPFTAEEIEKLSAEYRTLAPD